MYHLRHLVTNQKRRGICGHARAYMTTFYVKKQQHMKMLCITL